MIGFFFTTYTIPRFFMEFLRRPSSDPRYAGLTPGQWVAIAGLITGVAVLIYAYSKGEKALEAYRPTGEQDQPLTKEDLKKFGHPPGEFKGAASFQDKPSSASKPKKSKGTKK